MWERNGHEGLRDINLDDRKAFSHTQTPHGERFKENEEGTGTWNMKMCGRVCNVAGRGSMDTARWARGTDTSAEHNQEVVEDHY